MFDLPPETRAIPDIPAIVVTASRAPEAANASPASVSLIDADRIDRLGAPLVPDLLRLIPSAAVAVSGPAGSLTQVRIRGSEANHTLLFVEGIRANDPAAGNEPRFELLNADLASRVEVVRGPQSALWGSEAIGGVVAVEGQPAGSGGTAAQVEYGSFDTARIAARTALGKADRGLSIGLAAQRSDGIDSFSGDGDRDGYRNIGARSAGHYRLSPAILIGGSGFALFGRSQFDGYDPLTFARADTLDRTRNRIAAGRLFVEAGDRAVRYAVASASLLGSSNRNLIADTPVNRTAASRRVAGIEAGQRLGQHLLIVAAEAERERFEARDTAFGGFTDQDRSRGHQSVTAEWRYQATGRLSGGIALRHDIFSRFRDATTARAALRVGIGGGFALAANVGEGIAQPSFFDLYGFFPGSFAGNPALRPESSRGGEVALRYDRGPVVASLTYYRQRLNNEIIDIFDPASFQSSTANAAARSRRQGVEVEAAYRPSPLFRLTAHYAYLDASEPAVASGMHSKEPRRPRHSGSAALDGAAGRLSYGASLAHVGARRDINFDVFPSRRVTLGAYWLAGGRIAYRLSSAFDAHVRVSNAFGERYEDVIGYRTEGRSVHAGLRLAFGD